MLIVVAVAAALACASVGGGLYEFSVVDPFWPKRPDLVQPALGGISRKRFWIAIHVAFEVVLIADSAAPPQDTAALAISDEPAGGSPQPTTKPNWVGALGD